MATSDILIAAGMVAFFVAVTLGELWCIKKLGFDVLADLQVTRDSGSAGKYIFKAAGAVGFVIAQPFFLFWLFAQIADAITVRAMEALLPGLY